jgi:hypothetical protein
MKKLCFTFATLILLSLTAFGQDPLKVAPDAYKLEFENEWVKVTRVHYAAKSKIPAHDHTETGAAYVYLNDSGPVIFRHIGLAYVAITRPATKAGSFRLYRAVKEVHEVENQNDGPSDFLRVEFKTASDAEKPLRGKFYREEYKAGENFEKLQFENGQIRATRIACSKTCEISADATSPVLLVVLTPIGKDEAGKTRWIAPGKKEVISNAGDGHFEFIRFDLKSKPTTEKPNAHPHE